MNWRLRRVFWYIASIPVLYVSNIESLGGISARLVVEYSTRLMVVNGAGLAMATNDTIDLLYGKSANFLDAGGKATSETIKEAFRLILKNRDVWS